MVEYLDQLIANLSLWWGLGLFFLAAALEYVVPPFPGDTITLLGGVYAVRGHHPWPLMFGVVVAGSVLGALINYQVGHWLGARFEQHPGKPFFGITHAQLEGLQARMRRRGPWLLIINRFLPGIRGLIFVAAGAAHMPRVNALFFGMLSAMAHTALVLTLGATVGGNLDRLVELMNRYQRGALLLVGIALGVALIRVLLKRQTRAT